MSGRQALAWVALLALASLHLWWRGKYARLVESQKRAESARELQRGILFNSMADFFASRPDSFLQTFGNPNTNYAVTSYGAFLQDHVSLLPRGRSLRWSRSVEDREW